jgi:hypothetical protein
MICAREECGIEFEQKTHNQKYCSDECCRIATNKRIMEKYYEKKAIKSGSARFCNKCKMKLSRYNYGVMCNVCEAKSKSDKKKNLLEMLNVASGTSKN